MNAAVQPTRMHVERRFPLDLHKTDDNIRRLYETAKQARWNPEADLPWDQHDLAAASPEARSAAARVWSRRAWVEYTGMTETPALLIRFCLELNRESDPKYFLTVRNTEEALHVESFHRYAEACCAYVEAPANPAWQSVFNRTMYRDALNAETSIDAYVVTHCAFVDNLEFELSKAWLKNAQEPLAHAMLERCARDYERHAAFGWLYAERRVIGMDTALRERVSLSLQRHIEDAEFAGYHCSSLSNAIDAAPEADDLEIVARAGLGAVSAADEIAIFRRCVSLSRERFADMGITLPPITHKLLGSM